MHAEELEILTGMLLLVLILLTTLTAANVFPFTKHDMLY